jgi:hypothetical protein
MLQTKSMLQTNYRDRAGTPRSSRCRSRGTRARRSSGSLPRRRRGGKRRRAPSRASRSRGGGSASATAGGDSATSWKVAAIAI